MGISALLHCNYGSVTFCMTMFCSLDDARVENLHLGQSVTSLQYPVLVSHLNAAQTLAC